MTKYEIVSGVVGSFAFVTLLSPAVFAVDVEVSQNGANSQNTVVVSGNVGGNGGVDVDQKNVTKVETVVSAVALTGDLTASKNTGGKVVQETGDATTKVNVSVTGGDNTATVSNPCGCEPTPVTVNVKNNGADSKNTVMVGSWKSGKKSGTDVDQTTKTLAGTVVGAVSDTGLLTAKKNTGGKVKQTTGNAKTTVKVDVVGGSSTVTL